MILMVSTSNCHYPFPIRWEFGLERINQQAVNRLKYQLPCLLFYHKACLAGLCHWNKNKACQLKHLLAALVHLYVISRDRDLFDWLVSLEQKQCLCRCHICRHRVSSFASPNGAVSLYFIPKYCSRSFRSAQLII